MCHFQFIFLLLIICWSTGICYNSDRRCEVGTTCQLDRDCPELISALYFHKPHGLRSCGFKGLSQLLCCPNNINQKGEDTPVIINELRRSQKACQKYIEEKPVALRPLILGGQNAGLGEFPHMAHIGYQRQENSNRIHWRCGGSLITEKFVLTAAHCINNNGMPPVRVRVGFVNENNLSMQEIEILNALGHPNFTRRDKFNDIGLIELRDSVKLTFTAYPACLHQENDNPSAFTITGWGLEFSGRDSSEGSSILKKAGIHLVNNSECQRQFKRTIPVNIGQTQLCAASENYLKDACEGDSGGPLQVKLTSAVMYNIVGITSYGLNCGGPAPGIYTKVSSYLDWIESYVWL